jgi:hypothetical protein
MKTLNIKMGMKLKMETLSLILMVRACRRRIRSLRTREQWQMLKRMGRKE